MNQHSERKHVFGRHDRLVIDGQSYRVAHKEKGTHFLQLVNGDLIEDHFVPKTDRQIDELRRSGRLRHEEGYFSKTLSLLRVRHDNSDLNDLSEAQLRTVAWKKEWCVRFLRQAGDPKRTWRPKRTQADMRAFVEAEKDLMDRWYLDQFGERRAPGRTRTGEIRKAFDYPSPSALRDWLRLYSEAGYRMEAFRPGYDQCGNRSQIDPRALPVVSAAVQKYASVLRPTMGDICEDVELQLDRLNGSLRDEKPISVSDKAIRRRLNAIDPFIRDFGRRGPDFALRKYTPVGKGLNITKPLERVEMDDWEVDLHSLIVKSSVWKTLSKKERDSIPRTRITVTAAIDCATRCIVGFHATPYSPSAATAKSALRSTMIDKTPMALLAGAKSDWNMYGRPGFVATDGGPVFRGEFEEAVRRSRVNRVLPDQDPRMRGTIEAFFRTFKRLCRYFAGYAFKDVVEKGDYPAEKMASLTFDAVFRAAIVFIVDRYHHRKHRGLEGGTPYGAWQYLTRDGLSPSLSDEQLIAAFGFSIPRSVDKHGISFLNLSYNSDELGKLYRLVDDEQVDAIVDPNDMGAILVRIPPKHRGRILSEDRHYLTVSSVGGIGRGVPLVAFLEEDAAVKKLVKEQQDAGRPFRLAAHRYLLDEAEKARKTANVPSHELTQKNVDLIVAAIGQKTRAAMSGVNYAASPPKPGNLPGQVVASARRTEPRLGKTGAQDVSKSGVGTETRPPSENDLRQPFGGGMNLYGEDE
ncbi:Mu transposase C-terminal domain-containing protein [Allomesorhizobium camelthorni]|nr:Mu transposase C-terminal domain-containing protein [Mesorhizobium camelthorni]